MPNRRQPEQPHRMSIEPELVRIPAGSFLMGTSDEQIRELKARFVGLARDSTRLTDRALKIEQPQHTVRLPEYFIGRYPVTNLQYAAFIQATGHGMPLWPGGRYPTGHANHPVDGLPWDDAQAYVAWLRERTGQPYRLPTEAEWEKAARGTDGRLWPWGDETPEPNLCNFDDHEGGTSPVGRYSPQGDSPYGCADMAGNVWEWCSTAYANYPYDADDGREETTSNAPHIRRGESHWSQAWWVRCARRSGGSPLVRIEFSGFRVARDVRGGILDNASP